jgi:hypothetical protein
VVLQLSVPELVDRPRLPQHLAVQRALEKAHEVAGALAAKQEGDFGKPQGSRGGPGRELEREPERDAGPRRGDSKITR